MFMEMNLQKFAGEPATGVVPCYVGMFKVGEDKTSSTTISHMESCSISFDNGVEEWYAYGEEGWVNRLMTAKAVTVSVKGKRDIGDAGNDFVADKAMKNGQNAQGYFALVFPDGTEVSWDKAVYNVTALNMADSTNVSPLDFDVMSNGKPTVTPSAA